MLVTNLCELVKMDLLIIMKFLFMHSAPYVYNYSNIWHDKYLGSTNLCNWHLTCIFCINKSHAEICHFMVL